MDYFIVEGSQRIICGNATSIVTTQIVNQSRQTFGSGKILRIGYKNKLALAFRDEFIEHGTFVDGTGDAIATCLQADLVGITA